VPFFYKAGLIQNQNASRIAELLDHIIAADIPRTVGIPASTSEYRLHLPRNLIVGVFGQLPTILALSTAYQAIEIQPDLLTRL
jgi:hypothetical protein